MFYIYVYLDPRKLGHYCYHNICFIYEPFYIGKGQIKQYILYQRHLSHLKRIKSKKIDPFKNKLCRILKAGFSLLKKVLRV